MFCKTHGQYFAVIVKIMTNEFIVLQNDKSITRICKRKIKKFFCFVREGVCYLGFMWIAFSFLVCKIDLTVMLCDVLIGVYTGFWIFFLTLIPKGGEIGLVDFVCFLCCYFDTVHSLVTVEACFVKVWFYQGGTS